MCPVVVEKNGAGHFCMSTPSVQWPSVSAWEVHSLSPASGGLRAGQHLLTQRPVPVRAEESFPADFTRCNADAVVPNQGDVAPQGTCGNLWRHFSSSQPGEGGASIEWALVPSAAVLSQTVWLKITPSCCSRVSGGRESKHAGRVGPFWRL